MRSGTGPPVRSEGYSTATIAALSREISLETMVAEEAAAAHAALASLDEARVPAALEDAARLLQERAREVLEANRADLEAAESGLDAGALDRLRLDEARLE